MDQQEKGTMNCQPSECGEYQALRASMLPVSQAAVELQAAGRALLAASEALTTAQRAVPAGHAKIAAQRALEMAGRLL